MSSSKYVQTCGAEAPRSCHPAAEAQSLEWGSGGAFGKSCLRIEAPCTREPLVHSSRLDIDQLTHSMFVLFRNHPPVVFVTAPCRQALRYKPGSKDITYINKLQWERDEDNKLSNHFWGFIG